MAANSVVGALIGWRRDSSEHGIILSLQLASTNDDARHKRFDRVALALNDRQLRSLARDLQRAADERGLQLWSHPRRFPVLSRLWSRLR